MNGQVIKEEHVDTLKMFLQITQEAIKLRFKDGAPIDTLNAFKEEYPNLFE